VKAGKSTFEVSAQAGKITGVAPLFERFSLGNTETLRGWNKYDIDPLGGDRMGHTSIEYRYSALGVFFDHGAVWGNGLEKKNRQSVGLMLDGKVGIAMPLECAGHCGITFFANFNK
jgi:outer membrane protein assembly factor BamA